MQGLLESLYSDHFLCEFKGLPFSLDCELSIEQK